MSNTSLCRLCGGLLKEKARRCGFCGAKVNRTPGHTPASVSPVPTPNFSAPAPPPPVPNPQVETSPSPFPISDCTLSEKLIPLNKKRQFFFTLSIPLLVLAGISFLLFALEPFASTLADILFFFLFLFCGILGGVFFFLSTQHTKEKKALISTYIVEEMLKEHFTLSSYEPLSTFSLEQIKASHLRRFHRIHGNDLIKATYKGIPFQFSDIRLIRQSGRSSHTIFRGQWLIIDLEKAIPAPLMVSEIEQKGKLKKGIKVFTGHSAFDLQFTTLTENQELAPQILTPEFIHFLLATDNDTFAHQKHLLFSNKRIHMGIKSNQDFFEPCKNVDNIPLMRQRLLGEIDSIKEALDGVLLTNLFSAEDT